MYHLFIIYNFVYVCLCICLYELVVRTQFTHINYLQTYIRCHHNTRPRSAIADARRSSKNTACPAWMKLVVRAKRKSMSMLIVHM